MPVSSDFMDYLTERLEPLGPITWRRMFGGAGVYCDGLFFAIVADDQLYLKVDDETRPAFEGEELEPFTYETAKGVKGVMSYHAAPDGALDDDETLLDWSQMALGAALRAARKKTKKTVR